MEEQRRHGIFTIATKYGLVQGILSFAVFLTQTLASIKQDWVMTLANTGILIVLIAMAHGQFKRIHDGAMTYSQGVGAGTLLSSAGALVRGAITYVYVGYINTGYLANVVTAQRFALEHRGITGQRAQLAMGIASAITTPIGIAVRSLISGVIAGLVVALIVSIFTQKGPRMAVV